MSICDRCMVPGYCCRQLKLSGGDPTRGFFDDPQVKTHAQMKQVIENHGLPFEILKLDFQGGETPHWSLTCPKLDRATGRCTIYENRPALCARFEPQSDPLCVHYQGIDNGDASAEFYEKTTNPKLEDPDAPYPVAEG